MDLMARFFCLLDHPLSPVHDTRWCYCSALCIVKCKLYSSCVCTKVRYLLTSFSAYVHNFLLFQFSFLGKVCNMHNFKDVNSMPEEYYCKC